MTLYDIIATMTLGSIKMTSDRTVTKMTLHIIVVTKILNINGAFYIIVASDIPWFRPWCDVRNTSGMLLYSKERVKYFQSCYMLEPLPKGDIMTDGSPEV
jgi:hypothetical protein